MKGTDGTTRITVGWVFWTLALTIVATAVIERISRIFFSKDFGFGYVVAVVLGVLVLRRVVRAVWGEQESIPQPLRLREPDVLTPRRPFAEVTRWENRMSWTAGDPERFETAVRPKLRDLTAERLRQRHGVNIDEDPARAYALTGDALWQFLHQKLATTPTPAQLAWYVDRIEEI